MKPADCAKVIGERLPLILEIAEPGKEDRFELSNRMMGGQQVVPDFLGLNNGLVGVG